MHTVENLSFRVVIVRLLVYQATFARYFKHATSGVLVPFKHEIKFQRAGVMLHLIVRFDIYYAINAMMKLGLSQKFFLNEFSTTLCVIQDSHKCYQLFVFLCMWLNVVFTFSQR